MTINAPDFPDFQASLAWRSGNLFTNLQTPCPVGNTESGWFSILNFASVEFIISPFLAGVQVTASWAVDSAGAQVIRNDLWYVSHATGLHVIMPARGNYLQVTIDNTGASSETVMTWVAGTNVPVTKPQYPVPRDDLGAEATSVPANTTQVFQPAWIHQGQAWIYLKPADTAGKLNFSIDTVDETSAKLRQLWSDNGFTGAADVALTWPDDIVQVSITNTDTVSAHTLSWSVTHVPL